MEYLSKNSLPFQSHGYMPFEATFTRSVSGWVWGNIVFGGLIRLAIDAINGGMYKLTPEQLQADLKEEKKSTAFIQQEDQLYLKVVLAVDPSWEKVGTLKPFNHQ